MSEVPVQFWIDKAEQNYVANIGQLSPDAVKALQQAVHAGRLVCYRGCWDTGESWGLGPLKACWRKADV